jgi:acyl-CoA synthetase (AMP-forming)/AMP-acid ligase II
MTFAELLDGSRRIAAVLREAGVRPGEVVAFRVPQLLDAVLTFACFHEAAIGTVLPSGFEESGSRVIDWVVSTAPSGSPLTLSTRAKELGMPRAALI